MVNQIRKELAQKISTAEGSIMSGNPQDFAAYRYEVGVLEGLRRSLAVVKHVAESREKAEEDDD